MSKQVSVTTTDDRQMAGSPFLLASWLVENYGEHADAQGVSGPTAAVNETYRNVATLLANR